MAHNNKKVIQFDRNRASGPWQPLQPAVVTPEAAREGVLAIFRNNLYAVYIKQTSSSGFLMQGPDGRAQAAPIAHLIIVRAGGKTPEWKHIQRIKNDLMGEDAEAVELFPSEKRRIDATQTHVWCLPPGMQFPVGLAPIPAEPQQEEEMVPGSAIRRADLQFFVIETPQPEGQPPIIEVFANEADARMSYEKSDVPFPLDGIPEHITSKGGLRMLGHVPMEEEGAAWSLNAVVRRDELGQRISEAGAKMAAEQASLQARAMLPAGPPSIEDEMEAEGAFPNLVDGPMEVLEAEQLEALMRAGMAQKAAERAAEKAAKEAVDAAAEATAKAELEAMRAKMRGEGDGAKSRGDAN